MANGRTPSNKKFSIFHFPFFILLVGFAVRLYLLDAESLWYDELLQLDIARRPAGDILHRLPRHAALPLDYFITHFWILLGHQDFWVRLPAVIFGMLALPLAYQLGRVWLDRRTGLVLMALLALSPFHVYYSREARPYALLFFGTLLTCYAVWQMRRRIRWRYLLMLQLGVLLFGLAHFFAWVFFIPLGALLCFELLFSGRRLQTLKLAGAIAAAAGIVIAIILSLGWGSSLVKVSTGVAETVTQPEKLTAEAAEKPNHREGPQVDWPFVRDKLMKPLVIRHSETALWLFHVIAGLGWLYLLIRKKYSLAGFLLIWLVVPVTGILLFLMHRGTFFAPRYVIYALPAYFTLVAMGIVAIPTWLGRLERRWLPTLGLLLVGGFVIWHLSIGLNLMYNQRVKENWRLVGDFLRQNAGPQDTVLVFNGEETLNWYYPPAEAEPDSFDELAAIQAAVAKSERSWVVVSIFAEYLPNVEQVRAWLSEQGAIRLVLHPEIAVYYLGRDTNPDQLLAEIRTFALPPDHALYASLARENRRQPAVARQYFELAIETAPDEQTRAEYRSALEGLELRIEN